MEYAALENYPHHEIWSPYHFHIQTSYSDRPLTPPQNYQNLHLNCKTSDRVDHFCLKFREPMVDNRPG